MQSSMILTWVGALLILCGVVLAASQVLWKGRLSDARKAGPAGADATLEPKGRVRALNPKTHWPAVALVALGIILMLAEAVF
jgi:uncharacterized membrane protein